MEYVYRKHILRRSVLLLSLCLLILYAGWSRNKQGQDARTVEEQIVESTRLGREGRADKRRFQFINHVATDFDKEAAAAMELLVKRKAPSRDPLLIDVVRRLIDPPPNEGLKMLTKAILHTPQSKEVDALLKQKTKGFFVECGAYDGETGSNSLPFEHNGGWTGLLIEVSPYYYTQLLGKNRNVWSLNACLSPYDYATQLQFDINRGGQLGRVKLTNDLKPTSSSSSVDKNTKRSYAVPCFPLETILIAINQTRVDFFSLDVEGLELEVLKTIPFDRIDIQVLTVEYLHGRGGKDAHKSFMKSKGFLTHKDVKFHEPRATNFAHDYIFINNRSSRN